MSKEALQNLIQKLQNKKWQDEQSKGLMSSIQEEQTRALQPVLENMAKMMTESMSNEFAKAVKQIKVDTPQVNVPDIQIPEIPPVEMPEIKVPTPRVTVNVPPIKMPPFVWPDGEMPINGWVNLMGYNPTFLENPFPVQLRDKDGKPVDLSGGRTAVMGSSGPARQEWIEIRGLNDSTGASLVNPDGRVKVELPTGSSGLTDTELRAAHLDVQQVSGSIDSVKVTGFDVSVAASLIDSSGVQYSGSNPLPVVFGASATSAVNIVDSTGVAYESDNPFPVQIVSGGTATSAVNIVDSTGVAFESDNPFPANVAKVGGNAVVVGTGYQDNALRVVHATDAVASVNIVAENVTLEVLQVSGSVFSTNLLQTASNPTVVGGGWKDNALRVVEAQDSVVSTNLMQTAGNATVVGTGYQDNALRTVEATDSVVSTNLMLTRGSSTVVGTGYQDNALRIVHATDAIVSVRVDSSSASVAANIVDSSGVAYTTTNPLPIGDAGGSITIDGSVSVSGSITSTVVTGPTVADAADDGSAPVQFGGIARTANPTAVAANDVVKATFDDLGRQIVRPLQVRDQIATAYATFATGTEATLLAGVAATYLDLIYILAANNSTAAVGIDIRGNTAGSVVMHLEIPANGVTGVSLPVPIPQQATGDGTGGSWTVDLPDITGTTVSVSALFTKEV